VGLGGAGLLADAEDRESTEEDHACGDQDEADDGVTSAQEVAGAEQATMLPNWLMAAIHPLREARWSLGTTSGIMPA